MRYILMSAVCIFLLTACTNEPAIEIRDDFKKHYTKYNVEGSFVLYDKLQNKYIFYNRSQTEKPISPASTFKICNSLIGLETRVINDEHFVIPWDSVMRQNSQWNCDHDLQQAFKNSTVWYYKELARRVGADTMKYWLDAAGYGNADTSGGIDKFWLTGGLRISPMQQIDFLKKLDENKLPFSKRAIDIVKHIMIAEDTLGYVLRAKAGWGADNGNDIGWYVGYLEIAGNTYYFANCIQTSDFNNMNFAAARIEIVYAILRELQLIKRI